MARPKRREIDKLKTKVWYEYLKDSLGKTTAYEMDEYFGSNTDRNWYKYKDGMRVPTHSTLQFVEKMCPNSRVIFDIGPNNVQLWKALNGAYVDLWDVVDEYYPEYKEDRKKELLGIVQYLNFLTKELIVPVGGVNNFV